MNNIVNTVFGQNLTGLTTQQAAEAQLKFGKNTLASANKNHLLKSILDIVREPMFILLAVACLLYFFLGDTTEAVMMLVSIVFVAGIGIYQETKSEKALDALRAYTEPLVKVLRDGVWAEIPAEELVPGDLVNIGEGERIAADGLVLQQNDLTVAEAVLTGESLAVEKKASGSETEAQNRLFHGTTVASGQSIFQVTATGNRTKLGQLGLSIESIETSPTPLQVQITAFVKKMGILGGVVFAAVLALNFALEGDFWTALLFSLTIAMAIIPEEIPVAFSSFMALGAFRMIKSGILAKQPKTVESLGSATVICLDKTGTITENNMSLAETIDFSDGQRPTSDGGRQAIDIVLQNAFWASEPAPIDAMELALQQQVLADGGIDFRKKFELIHEYPLGGSPPMMTHIWANRSTGAQIIACKGAVERVLSACKVSPELEKKVLELTEEKAALGYRILGVAVAAGGFFEKNKKYPDSQDDFDWQFAGLAAFYDPPKTNVGEVLKKFQTAGIRTIMITGDHVATAQNIGSSVGLIGFENTMTGSEAMALDETALRDAVRRVNIFARMFPEAKLRVVEALKSNGEIVAMSGDGVNDGPALKAAQIGVAMGKKGSDIAKTAATLVLLNDNLDDMATAIGMGRRIYDNLRKAIRYVISIHFPILMTVLVPLVFGWEFPHMLLPLHVIFLELVMDPIAAIAFENEPAEPNLMQKTPRLANFSLFSGRELAFSIVQGAALGAGVLFVQWFATGRGLPENSVRASVFTTIVLANLFLVLANRSMDFPIYRTIFYKNKTLPIILGVSLVMLAAVLYMPFVAELFRVAPISFVEIGWCAMAAFVSVAWFEVWKVLKKK